MKFITERKRAEGMGSASHGTEHHWKMLASSICLVVLVPLVILIFGSALGRSHQDVVAYFQNPFLAIALGIGLTVGLLHIKMEVDEAVEDYVQGMARKLTLIAVSALVYTLIAVGLFALLKLAL